MSKRLTAKQLRITDDERKELIRVRNGLAAGKYLHRRDPIPHRPTKRPIFNMGTWTGRVFSCGTAHCVGIPMSKGKCNEQ